MSVNERKVDGSANVITWDHDSLGRLIEEINPLGGRFVGVSV